MEDLMNQLQGLLEGTDLPIAGVTDYQLMRVGTITCLVVLLLSLLNCFFGLKLLKVWTTILGFIIGFALGCGISLAVGATTTVSLIVGAVAGIILAILGFWLYLAGVFILCWFMGFGLVLSVAVSANTGNISTVVYIVGAVIGLVIAIVALRFVEPMVIISTGLQGGLTAGAATCTLANIPGAYTYLIIGVVLSIIGIIVQFFMDSRKKVKQHLKHADQVRAEHSTENEVEKARAALDYTDKVPEDPEADDYYDEEDES